MLIRRFDIISEYLSAVFKIKYLVIVLENGAPFIFKYAVFFIFKDHLAKRKLLFL